MSFLAIPHLTVQQYISYYSFTTYAIDSSYYYASNTTFPDFQSIIGSLIKIKLIEIEFSFSELRYIGTPVGEYPRRILNSFLAEFRNFSLNGNVITDSLSNDLIIRNLTIKNSTVNFGNGIICDNFKIPQLINNLSIDDIPPSVNTPSELIMNMIVRYNFNY